MKAYRGRHTWKEYCLAIATFGITLCIYYKTASYRGDNHGQGSNLSGHIKDSVEPKRETNVKMHNATTQAPLNGWCDKCNKWQFPLEITPRKTFCESSPHGNRTRNIDLLLFITSKHQNLAHRQLLREIYNPSQWPQHRLDLVFLFGYDPTHRKTTENALKRESDTYGDILQSKVHGTYYNMTLIVYNGFQWATDNCPNANFIGKISDDTILNIPGIFKLLDTKGESELRDVVFGDCNTDSLPPFRDKRHRWYMDRETYPLDRFPAFCSGGAFFMSTQTAREMLSETENIALPNPFDDVNIGINIQLSGHCVCPVPGLYMFGSNNRLFNPAPMYNYSKLMNCANYQALEPFLGVHLHRLGVKKMRLTWGYRTCYEGKTPSFKDVKCRRRHTCVQNNIYPQRRNKGSPVV